MGRMARGWALTKESWAVVRRDRSLLAFPVIAGITGLLAALIFFGAGAGVIVASGSDWAGVPLFLIGAYALTVISIFASVALASCAVRALEGEDTTVREGLHAARQRMRVILGWAAVQLLVGVAISIIQSLLREGAGALVGAIVGGLANLAWTVATFFVVPIIALEGLGPIDALKRSTKVIRERWGEGVTAAGATGLIVLAAFLPAVALIVGGFALAGSVPAAGAALIVLGVIIIAIAALIQSTVMAVFKVALYKFATTGETFQGFAAPELAAAFAPRRAR